MVDRGRNRWRNTLKYNAFPRLVRGLFLWLAIGCQILPVALFGQKRISQSQTAEIETSHSSHVSSPSFALERINRQMATICTERINDPRGSLPIDEMQMKPSLPVNNPAVLEGLKHSERLLPTARDLAIQALKDLADSHHLESWRLRRAIRHISAVTSVKPDMDLRDNASVYYENQRTIHFGTIFLASLKSDEGMISILAHELTHIGDGKSNVLQPLFNSVGLEASRDLGIPIEGSRPEELTCDLIGVMAARKLIENDSSEETVVRRISRSVEHNCVSRDETDEVHLSPRNTMRALLALEPFLAGASNP
jgi:hypothetical protein